MAGAFTAQARLLDAAEGRDLGGDQSGVDADHPRLQRLGHAPDAAQVAGVEIARQAEDGVVGQGDPFFFGVEADDARNGAEGLLAAHLHVLGHA
ncbi:hypothetical protein D3C77_524980 [compost metagenome]